MMRRFFIAGLLVRFHGGRFLGVDMVEYVIDHDAREADGRRQQGQGQQRPHHVVRVEQPQQERDHDESARQDGCNVARATV